MQADSFYYYDDLVSTSSIADIRTRYKTLNRVFYRAIDDRLEGVRVKFAGPLAKIQYLIREYRIRESSKDKSLAIAINATRNRLRHLDEIDEGSLVEAFPHDLKAICKFISFIYDGHEIPEQLKSLFPLETEEHYHDRLTSDGNTAIESLRCTVERWDDTYIYVIRGDNGMPARIDYATPNKYSAEDWSYIGKLLIQGEQLNIIRPRIISDDILSAELIIFNPDYLINVTSVAACFEEYGCSALWNLIGRIKPNTNTKHTILGNFAGQMLDEAAYTEKKTYAESINDFFRSNALSLACCDEIDKEFHTNAMAQQKNIYDIMHSQSIHQKNNDTLSTKDLILEPSFFCETLGLQGRMDFIHLNQKTIIEQKSGKGAFSHDKTIVRQHTKHYVQLLLYRAIFHYAYDKISYEDLASYLFYSKYPNGLIELGSAPKLLFEAIKIRNQIAWGELHYSQEGMNALEKINPETAFPMAKGNTLWERFQKVQLTELLLPIHKASELERAYYFRFLKFISAEHVLAKIGTRSKENSGFASLWESSTEEKRQAGNIYERLSILEEKAENDRITDIRFSLNGSIDTEIANFRIGDIVVCYPYAADKEPDATQEIVFRATITDIDGRSITIRLRNAQHHKVFTYYSTHNVSWAIEHDFMEASFTALYRSMHSFLSATPERRSLILGTRLPKIDDSMTLIGDYAQKDNTEFNDIVLGAMQTKDIYIIIGPPGTGKTSYGMLNVLKEQLLHKGTSVLLMAYTNRAVDEICSKLKEEDIDFIRLGNDFSCSPEYRDKLLISRVADCKNVDDVRKMIVSARVICGTTTTLNSHTDIFKLKHFDLAIVDEASQILEPHVIGLLSAKCGERNAIDKFVLIGDEKQLPAVVQQNSTESTVSEKELNDIMLTNCRLSFFERLLKIYGKDNHQFCHVLSRQGRMHPLIAAFPSEAFYCGNLNPVPLPHQKEATPDKGNGNNWIEDMLITRRLAFINCKENPDPAEPDKMNTIEAELIADIVAKQYAIDGSLDIGVIVPYRNQISTVRNAIDHRIKDNILPADMHDITIDTVERYQGSQRDLIIYGFTIKKRYQLNFLTDNVYYDEEEKTFIDRKLNVAMTRARKRLIMVGNEPLLRIDPTFSRLLNYCKGCNSLFSSDASF